MLELELGELSGEGEGSGTVCSLLLGAACEEPAAGDGAGAPPLVEEDCSGGLLEAGVWSGPTITGPIPVGSQAHPDGVVLGLGEISGRGEIAGTD